MVSYIGIENELVSFRHGERIDFGSKDYFDNLKEQFEHIYNISSSAIRTDTGNGFYIDGGEIEINTPPIMINKGFATRLTDSLLIGRNKVIDSNPDLIHTGYSMHWNLTVSNHWSRDNFYKKIYIPFQLFALTPVSIGSGGRHKGDRYELLGDSINNEEQISAAALLFGTYSLCSHLDGFSFEINENKIPRSNKGHNFIERGRDEEISGQFKGSTNENKISAQQYLEGFYYWLQPTIKKLGTKQEIDNLEAFIYGDKKLEFDKFEYYAKLLDLDKKEETIYKPFEEGEEGTILKKSNRKIEVPLEGKLLGKIIETKKDRISEIDWNRLDIYPKAIFGIGEIYNYAHSLDRDLPIQNKRIGIPKVNDIENFIPRPKIEYEIIKKRDNSILENNLELLKYVGNETRRELGEFFFDSSGGIPLSITSILCCGLIGLIFAFGVKCCTLDEKMNQEVEQIVEKYSTNNELISEYGQIKYVPNSNLIKMIPDN